MLHPFIAWLNLQCERVTQLEKHAEHCLHTGDTDEYRATMQRKALLLASLADDGASMLASLPQSVQTEATATLRRFSRSAENALSLNSVFYMSALLFPEDHQRGEPNDLEVFRDRIKAAL